MPREAHWKPRKENEILGTQVTRLDGVAKAGGTAKYSADINTDGTLIAKLLTAKHAYAKIVKLNVEPAKKSPGVRAVHSFLAVGDDVQWDGAPIVAVAADRAELADDAIRAIEIEYEVLEHFVDEDDLETAEQKERTKKPRESTQGDVAAALKQPGVTVHKGYYGVNTITHCCLEPHGSHCEWDPNGNGLKVHLSTQNVSGTAGQFAGPLGLNESDVEIHCDFIGGGFGSKFQADEWGIVCAKLAKEADRPVKLMLDRPTELKIAGQRPSGFGNITIAADKTGRIVAWDSEHWGSDGLRGGTVDVNQFPYVFDFENRNRKATGLVTNTGGTRAWRAPNHPQLCAMTCTAIDDVAAKIGMDTLDVFLKNLDRTPKPEVYKAELMRAAELIGWKENWHPHGKGNKGPIKRGLGVAIHRWGGRAHAGSCLVKVHPDGTVESTSGTQDIGTGTRTAIGMVLAETFGIPLSMTKVNIGSSKYPRSGPSGGSTTIGGVTGPNRRASLELLWKIFDLVAAKYEVAADTLKAVGGNVMSGNVAVCTWKDAARLVGPMGIEQLGEGPKKDGLTDDGVGGVQMADVSVDIETGKVKVNKFVAVQDCGLVVNEMTARSQVEGGLIMGIAFALTEERIMDNKTGRFINADMVNYKLPRIGDIGELVVEFYQPDDEYNRGVIGLGEPPVISPGAALSNAVANAIGVRVPVLPMTPKSVLDALEQGGQA